MKNNSLKEISQKLSEAKSVLLFPHINLDGDALGSSVALCRALRIKGIESWILLEDDIPANLRFLDKGYCTWDEDIIAQPDICVCVDCGDKGRFPRRGDKFLKGGKTMCIDHHKTTEFFCDYNYVDGEEAATGQIIYNLIQELGIGQDREIGEAVYAAIITDTGNYQYSNTQQKSHLITAQLYDWGVDFNGVSVEIYENDRMEKLLLRNMAMETLTILEEGLGALVFVTREMLKKSGAVMDETEGLSQELRSIAGVEYAAVLKEYGDETIRVSLRAKTKGDVSKIAQRLGGGGHTKAAGCTINAPMPEAVKMVKQQLITAIKEL